MSIPFLYLEGDRFQSYRLLRSVKNRFGATSEVGVFEMRERGMVEITNPSEAFLAERMVNAPGSAIAVTMEGTRPLLVEIQGLDQPHRFWQPAPHAQRGGFQPPAAHRGGAHPPGRVCIWASRISLSTWSAALTIDEPAADLADGGRRLPHPCAAHPVRADTVLIGEIGLSGELRMVGQMPARLQRSRQAGFQNRHRPPPVAPRRALAG